MSGGSLTNSAEPNTTECEQPAAWHDFKFAFLAVCYFHNDHRRGLAFLDQNSVSQPLQVSGQGARTIRTDVVGVCLLRESVPQKISAIRTMARGIAAIAFL